MSGKEDPAWEEKLEQARKDVEEVTDNIIDNFFKRQKLMREIADAKNQKGDEQPIFQHQREVNLINKYVEKAKKEGINATMVELLVGELMSFGKWEQGKILNRKGYLNTNPENPEVLKTNLKKLTAQVAKHYDAYDKEWNATTHIINRERECIKEAFKVATPDEKHDLAIDLGCANGDSTQWLSKNFKRVIGYDISPEFVAIAKEKNLPSVEFKEVDLENGIPQDDNSVDLVLANFGSASEVSSNIFAETSRVLKVGGKAFLSFYNEEALANKWWRPWTNAFPIMINPANSTLDVEYKGTVYTIKAIPATAQSIQRQAEENGLKVSKISGSNHFWDFCPSLFFHDEFGAEEKVIQSIAEHENKTEETPPFLGQYLQTILEKR
jgi:ubiquinone/menaquinone biosynthesis C-methylase UbiE/chorismate mutase